MYEQIKQSLESLFDDALKTMEGFQKKTYESVFKNLYAKYESVIHEILRTCETEDGNQETIDEIASYIPKKAAANLELLDTKRKKEFQLLDYNMALVTFVTPVINYNRSPFCATIAESMIAQWNSQFPKCSLKTSSFENIEGGFKSRLCYVTTAVCQSQGKSDDCYELTLLREYRDQYLMEDAGEKELVQEYYNIAPTIVKRINHSADADRVYKEIWDTYLNPCIHMIEADKKEACKETYSKMVRELREKYLYS